MMISVATPGFIFTQFFRVVLLKSVLCNGEWRVGGKIGGETNPDSDIAGDDMVAYLKI